MKLDGQCLCGGVKISANVPKKSIGACHCGMCRKWSGAPALAVFVQGELEITGQELVKTFDSSLWAERGFCSNCGSHLFYRMKNGKFTNIPVGLLKDQNGFEFDLQVFVDNKPDYYDFSNETKNMTEQEVLKAFGAQ
ncbi:MAG: GFA family protein [Bdellovibrionales bacterium]